LCWVTAFACGSSEPGPELADPRGAARSALVDDPSNCFGEIPGACLTRFDFVDGILDEWVEKRFDGEFPRDQRGVDRLVGYADSTYRTRQVATEESREAVLGKLKAIYENPPVTYVDGVATADLGLVPTRLVRDGRTGWTVDNALPYVDKHQWEGREAGRALERLVRDYPDAKVFEAGVRIAKHGSLELFRVRWVPARRQVLVTPPGTGRGTYVSPKIDSLAQVRSGEQSLLTENLHFCGRDMRRWGDDPKCAVGLE
jgi:hypothetical protein